MPVLNRSIADEIEGLTDQSMMSVKWENLKDSDSPFSNNYVKDDENFIIERQAWWLTCQDWLGTKKDEDDDILLNKDEKNTIYFRVNPSDVQFTIGLRSSEKKTRTGTILHVWRKEQKYGNYRSSYFDEPRLQISFQSGNIIPYIVDQNGMVKIPEGLDNFYKYLSLLDSKRILSDGRPNIIYLGMTSKIFPSLVVSGVFDSNGTGWSESADNPGIINSWSGSLIVYDTWPKFNDYKELCNLFNASNISKTFSIGGMTWD